MFSANIYDDTFHNMMTGIWKMKPEDNKRGVNVRSKHLVSITSVLCQLGASAQQSRPVSFALCATLVDSPTVCA